jgi:uncharacterized membrane protein YkoI
MLMVSQGRAQIVAVAIAAALGGAHPAPAAPAAPVGIRRAQEAALARVPGRLANTTLALDRGRLVYRIDIDSAPRILTSVEVAAGSGRVLRVTDRRERGPFPREPEAP